MQSWNTLDMTVAWAIENFPAKIENIKECAKQQPIVTELNVYFWYVDFHIINAELDDKEKGKVLTLTHIFACCKRTLMHLTMNFKLRVPR